MLYIYMVKRKKYRENDDKYNKMVETSREKIAYWRQANQIKEWFTNNTDYAQNNNDDYYEITQAQLLKIKDDCQKVLDNHKLASTILPIASGSFFGDTEYTQYYFDELQYTVEKIDEILKNTDWEHEAIEYYEWW